MAKQYRLVWNDQLGKLAVAQDHIHKSNKQFAARVVAAALAATALTTFGVPEARAEGRLECLETYTADTVLAANTTTTGPVCYEKTLTIASGAAVSNEINASISGNIMGYATEVVNFATGTTSGNLTNNGSILATFVPLYEGQSDSSAGAVIAFNGGSLVGNITNNGVIENVDAAVGRAIRLIDGSMTGDLVNTSSGTIEGGGGIDIYSGFVLDGSIKNDGNLLARGDVSGASAILVEGTINGSIENGLNNSDAVIYALRSEAVSIYGTVTGKIVNGGTITSDFGYGAIYLDGDLLGGIENRSTGKIISTEADAGIKLYAGSLGSIKNEGLISGAYYGIFVSSSAKAGAITNSGRITGDDQGIYYYYSTDDSPVNNSGGISGGSDGILYSYSTTGARTNSGTISGGDNGVRSYSGNIKGGITNLAGGVIEGAGSYGILLSSGTLSGGIRNAGKITGAYDGINLVSVVSDEGTTEGANIGDIVNEKGGEILGLESGSGIYSFDTSIGKIDNAGTVRGELNGIYLSSSSVAGGIHNSGLIEGVQPVTSYKYDSNGLSMTGSVVMGDIVNEATGSFVGGKNGIFLADGSVVTGALINKGLISGGLSEGERLYSVDDETRGLTSIVIDGNNTAQFVGAVNALDADMSVASGATYTVRNNVFGVKSFTNNGTVLFDSAAGPASLMLPDREAGYVFRNKGTVAVAAGTVGQLNADYVQDATGVFTSDVGSGTVTNGVFTGDYGKLQVSGNVELADGTTVKVNLPTAGLPKLEEGTRIQSLITAGGAMTAADSKITVLDNSRRYDFVATFDRASNELDLITIVRAAPILESVNLSELSAALGAARVLEDMQAGTVPVGMEAVFDRLMDLDTEAEIAAAVSQTLPAMLGATPQSLVSGLRSTNKFIQSRMESNQGLSAGDVDGGKHLWGRAFGTWSKQKDRGDISGFKSDTQGLVLGYDGAASDVMRIGVAAAYANSKVKGSDPMTAHQVKVDTYELITFGSYNVGAHTDLNYQFDIGVNKARANRHIPFMDSTAKARFSSFVMRGGVGAGHTLELGKNTSLTPSARVDYTYMRTGDYTETGAGPLNLKVEASTYEELVLSSDVKLKQRLGSIDLAFNAGGGYDALNDDAVTVATFVGGGPAFTTTGLKVSPWLYRGGVGVTKNGEGMEVSLRYDAEGRSSGYSNHTVSVRGRWSF